MKICVIQPFIPYPTIYGGQMRSIFFLKVLSELKGFNITVCVGCTNLHEYISAQQIGQLYGIDIMPFPFLAPSACVEAVWGTIQRIKPELIHFEELHAVRYIPQGELDSIPFTINAHNVEWLRIQRHLLSIGDKLTSAQCAEIFALQEYEKSVYSRALCIFCCSDIDARLIRDLSSQSTIQIIPNCVNTDNYSMKHTIPKTPPRFLFAGSLNYPPNVEACRFLAGGFWSKVQADMPGATLLIAGKDPVREIQLLGNTTINVCANPKSMAPLFLNSDYFVVPLNSGGGTRLKIIEAMAHGLPVISTSLGAEGLYVADGDTIFLSEGYVDFYKSVIRAVEHPNIKKIIQRARILVESEYSDNTVSRTLSHAFHCITS
jgi:glycosyltransferase involved in cell wall biosynthesis